MKLLTALLVVLLTQLAFYTCATDTPDNAGTNVAPLLEICYNNTQLRTRDYRLPTTMTTLIELIRTIEDGNPNLNSREIAIQLLQRFRQDGIRKTMKEVDSSMGLPYSPRGKESAKNKVQLKKLTPATVVAFDENIFSPLESCSLHYMVSSTVEVEERGDESNVCNKVARYTSRINKRNTELSELVSGSKPLSACPVETGVVWTKWGAVKAGLLISGIASGFLANQIPTDNGTIETIYASTLVGELSEVALFQSNSEKMVGNKGSWNSTVEPKYYFLSSNVAENLVLTDAEIRGGIDGFMIALGINKRASTYNNLKVSQILDLYYSRGLFNETTRACTRKELIQNFEKANPDKLTEQTTFFNNELDKEAQYGYTPNKANFPVFAQKAVSAFETYISSNLNDLSCDPENDVVERVSTDILIFVDTAWNHQIIQPLLSYILQNIDVSNYESSYTIFDGVNTDTIVNKSRRTVDFHKQFNLTEQQKYPNGFEYNKVIDKAESILKAKLDNETDLTGQSTIVLLLPHNVPSLSQSSYVSDKRNNVFKQYLPDLKILVAASGTTSSYNDLVSNASTDIVTLSDNDDQNTIKGVANFVVDRIGKIPRAVINSKCGASFSTTELSTYELTQYVEPSGIIYHKISPQYFYQAGYLKIKGQGYGTLIICMSRSDADIRQNTTGVDCETLNSYEISKNISSFCNDESVASCASIYISVQGTNSNVRCSEKACRFLDEIKYSITLENVGCNSSAEKAFGTIFLVALLFYILQF